MALESAAPAWSPALGAVRAVAMGVVAAALPLFLVTSGVRWVALGEGFYVEEFGKYRVGEVTGLSGDELRRVAHAIVTYFQSEPQRLNVVVTTPGGPRPLFNEREIQHMVDVQALMHRVLQVWAVALLALFVATVALVVPEPASGVGALARAAAIGGGIAVLLVGALGLAAFLDFGQLFLRFHLISFTNDLWLLDPTRDRLIQLFPQGFFFDAALRIAALTVAAGAVILAASLAALRATR